MYIYPAPFARGPKLSCRRRDGLFGLFTRLEEYTFNLTAILLLLMLEAAPGSCVGMNLPPGDVRTVW